MNILNIFAASGSVASSLFRLFPAIIITLSSFLLPASAVAGLPTTGEQKTLVLLVNFQENPTEQPLTVSEANNLVFGEVNNFFRENSFEQTWLSGEVAGWFTIPLSNQICDPVAFQNAADQKAVEAGVPLANYDRILYLWTKTACIEEGSGTMGSGTTRAYANGVFTARLIAHELGHNFGLYHSHALDCGAQTLSDNCMSIEYGDTYDVMGKPDIGYLNTFQKEQLGWLNGEHASKVTEVSQDGIYAIANYETQTDQPVTVKVPRGIDPDTGTMSWFYIEYRQSVGYDDFLDGRSYQLYRGDVTDGVVIRTGTDGDANSSNMLHFKTDSEYRAITGLNDWYDPAMPVGGSYTDPVSGVTLSLISAANNLAEIGVSFDGTGPGPGPVCTVSAPSVSATPISGTEAEAGGQVQYSVTLINNDSADCATASFDINAAVPNGWQAGSEQVSLAPGASEQVIISVTSATSAAANDYTITLQGSHSAQPQYSDATSVSYTVLEDTVSEPAPVAVDDTVTLSAIGSVVIDVVANDIVSGQTPVSVISFTQGSKGNVQLLSDGTIRYTPERRFKNRDSFSYTINNGSSSSTASVSITLEASSDDGSGNTGPGGGKGKKK